MKRIIWTLIGTAALSWGQASTPEAPKMAQRMIEVKNADANRLAHLVDLPGISVKYDASMHVIIVRGTQDAVAAVEEMIKKLDVAQPNIELTVYLVAGGAEAKQGNAGDIPADLAPTVKQLHGLFTYKNYRLLESFVLRGRDGRPGAASGAIAGTTSTYDFRYGAATVSGSTPRTVHFDSLSLNIGIPIRPVSFDKNGNPLTSPSGGLRTDLDVREGQKVVVGKSSVNGTDEALILVVTAKVVE